MTDADLTAFTSTFDGTIVPPAQATCIWNATYTDLTAGLIVRPRSARGVAQAVTFAQSAALRVAVRSGGHSLAGLSTAEGGLIIDLGDLCGFHLDPATRMVRVQAGLTWGEVATRLHAHGLAITAGDVATVGVGGLTQGGGIGWFVRQHGLAIDRLRSVELVTADGQIIRASATEHPDVFWAVRGAGANLGVITSLDFEAHPAGTVYGGLMVFDASAPGEAARLMGSFARLAHEAPDTLTTQGLLVAAPPLPFLPAHLVGQTVFLLLSVCSAPPEQAAATLAPLREMAPAVADLTGPLPYPAIFTFTEVPAARGFRHVYRSGFLSALTDDALNELGGVVQRMTPGQMVQVRPLGGAVARVPADATAFSHRHAPFVVTVGHAYLDPSGQAQAEDSTHRMWAPLERLSCGLYSNFAAQFDVDPAQSAFSDRTRERLARIKARLDPHNVFSRNVNVPPATLQPT